MRIGSLGALGVWIVAGVPLCGQEPAPSSGVYQAAPLRAGATPAPPSAESLPAPQGASSGPLNPPEYVAPVPPQRYVPSEPLSYVPPRPEPYHVWLRAEWLVWWVKDAPLPAPIAVVTDSGGNAHTIIGSSNTNFETFSGGRLGLGAWFDEHNNYGFETSMFSLGRRTSHQSASSDDNGSPSIGLSYVSRTPGQTGEFIQFLSAPGTFAADIMVSSSLQLWGAEINGAVCLLRAGGLEFTTLAGFRYLDLQESLYINSASTDLASGDFIALNDQFATRNQFYGGQIGARVNWKGDRLSVDATGKLALGGTSQVVDIHGNSFTASSDILPGGFYAQPSNIGHYTASQFGIIPSLELKLNYQLTHSLLLFIGYDFLYWNQVVRPGNQIDRNVNLTQSALLGNGALTGPASPTPLLSRTDFWGQGMTFGFEFRF